MNSTVYEPSTTSAPQTRLLSASQLRIETSYLAACIIALTLLALCGCSADTSLASTVDKQQQSFTDLCEQLLQASSTLTFERIPNNTVKLSNDLELKPFGGTCEIRNRTNIVKKLFNAIRVDGELELIARCHSVFSTGTMIACQLGSSVSVFSPNGSTCSKMKTAFPTDAWSGSGARSGSYGVLQAGAGFDLAQTHFIGHSGESWSNIRLFGRVSNSGADAASIDGEGVWVDFGSLACQR